MGLKLRYAKRYEVKWSGTGHFNYLQEDLNRFLYDLSGGFDDYLGEQLDILANLVLAEMGNLREFCKDRSPAIKEALRNEIGCLHTLYNYLIE